LEYVGETWYESSPVERQAEQKAWLYSIRGMLEGIGRVVVEVVTEVALENGQTICEVVESDGELALNVESEVFWEKEQVTCGE